MIQPTHIGTTYQGKDYTGSYVIEGQRVTVHLTGGGSKRSHLGGTPTDALVQLLLLELIVELKSEHGA